MQGRFRRTDLQLLRQATRAQIKTETKKAA
jgi:hypothetical protein